MLRDPRTGWEPKGPFREAHLLALESDYKKCNSKEEREFKYEFYFVKIAKKLCRSRYAQDYEYLNAMDGKRIEKELAAKERDEKAILNVSEIRDELSGNSGQLVQ